MNVQPQLLQMALVTKDVVYTPDWVAKDMVSFFKPTGRILEPCKGDGAFLRYLPSAEWCEIAAGKDFFAWTKPVDWIIGNPPYSAFGKWIYHAMDIARSIVFLAPIAKPFYSEKLFKKMLQWGRLKQIRGYGAGNKLSFPIGFMIGALHFEKDYHGPMYTTYYQEAMDL